MPLEAVVTCIGQSLREDLAQQMEVLDPSVRSIAVQLLEALPQCSNDEPIGFRFQETDGPSAEGRGRRRKRRLSAYNLHMRDCLKAGGTFATCVAEWRQKKVREGR